MKGGGKAGLCMGAGCIVLVGSLLAFGEDIERFLTDVRRDRQHPSLANLGRVLGDAARAAKDLLSGAGGLT